MVRFFEINMIMGRALRSWAGLGLGLPRNCGHGIGDGRVMPKKRRRGLGRGPGGGKGYEARPKAMATDWVRNV